MITKEHFLNKYNISNDLFESAGMTWDDLCYIYNDFSDKYDKYDNIRKNFIQEYLEDIGKKSKEKVNIHSVCSRVKDSEHLIAKIIRKKQEKQSKYKNLDKINYEKFITDLIGIRCLVLFKADWQSFHRYILSKFENNEECYVEDSIKDFDADEEHNYIAEKPKVHIRNGDVRDIYDEVLPPDCVIDGKVYRSVHYIIKYKGVYLEIQVRTLFEEGWGEIDHTVVYPYYQDDKILKEYTEMLNRLSGLADEMGSFFNKLKKLEEEAIGKREPSNDNISQSEKKDDIEQAVILETQLGVKSEVKTKETARECLQSVLNQ